MLPRCDCSSAKRTSGVAAELGSLTPGLLLLLRYTLIGFPVGNQSPTRTYRPETRMNCRSNLLIVNRPAGRREPWNASGGPFRERLAHPYVVNRLSVVSLGERAKKNGPRVASEPMGLLEPPGLSRRRACRPVARARRRAVLAETPGTPRAPRVRFPRWAHDQTQRATPFGAALCVCWWSRRESNPRPQVFYVTDLHA